MCWFLFFCCSFGRMHILHMNCCCYFYSVFWFSHLFDFFSFHILKCYFFGNIYYFIAFGSRVRKDSQQVFMPNTMSWFGFSLNLSHWQVHKSIVVKCMYQIVFRLHLLWIVFVPVNLALHRSTYSSILEKSISVFFRVGHRK